MNNSISFQKDHESKTSHTVHTSQNGEARFTFPPSVQIDLFNYLKPKQREAIRPYLRLIKSQYQEKLCVSLLDYLEGKGLDSFSEPVLAMLQETIVQECNLHPLTSRVMRPIQGLLARVASIGRGKKPLP